MNYTLKTELKLKTGEIYSVGSPVTIKFDLRFAELHGLRAEPIKIQASKLSFYVKGFKKPSLQTMERWMDDGIAKSITGKKCEPDGYGSDGSPSWLLVLGLI